MKVNTFCKIGITAGAAALLVGALAVPAQADPAAGSFGTLVGLGSDTTQGVVNGLATAIGGNKLASYDAITPVGGTASVVTRPGGSPVPRVSGSGAGRDTLLVSIGELASKAGVALSDGSTPTITSSVIDQLDFARSSGGPGAVTDPSGVLAYVPFARDAVDVAVDPSGPLSVVPFFVGNATSSNSTQPSLYNIYRGDVQYAFVSGSAGSYSYVGVGKTSAAPAGSTAYKIQPVLPKFGSGTRSYFLGQLGFTSPNADAADWATSTAHAAFGVVDTYMVNGVKTPIEEHDGSAIATATNGLPANTYAVGPFSIGQYVSQADAVVTPDRRHGVMLAKLGGTAVPASTNLATADYTVPTTGTVPALQTNPAFTPAMIRDVFNIVPSRQLDNPSSAIATMFSGPNSLVCQQPTVITHYGFLLETGTNNSITACGSTNTALRAYLASPSTTTVTAGASVVAGKAFTATATVVSNGDGGGKVYFETAGNNVLTTATIPNGASSATVSIPTTAAGTVPVHAVFVPRLDGVASSTSGDSNVSVTAIATAVTTTTVATATATAITVPKLTINKPATVAVAVNGGTYIGGTVTLRNGTTVLGTAAVAPGATGALVKFVPSKLTYSLSASYTPADGKVLASSSAVAAVKAAKGAATVTIKKVKTIKVGAKAKVSITLKGVVTPSGTVTIKQGSKTLVSKAKLTKGKVTVKIAKLTKGTHKVTVTYNGNTLYKAVKKTGSIKVKA